MASAARWRLTGKTRKNVTLVRPATRSHIVASRSATTQDLGLRAPSPSLKVNGRRIVASRRSLPVVAAWQVVAPCADPRGAAAVDAPATARPYPRMLERSVASVYRTPARS